MKKLLLLAVMVIGLTACTDNEQCYKCTMRASQKLGQYDLINSVNRCETDIEEYMNHIIGRGNVDWIECENGDEILRVER